MPDEMPCCLLCEEGDLVPWSVRVEGLADGEVPQAHCEEHGDLEQDQWEMTKI